VYVFVRGAEHDVNDPEFSILKQRLARRIIQEGLSDDDIQRMDIADLTKARTRLWVLGDFQTSTVLVHALILGSSAMTFSNLHIAHRLTCCATVQVAERTITSDLEGLIKAAVDTEKADYAVVTGVQIHNW
jgi:Limiting CO2-inducible proteins B/C beta carbonyic anhydrases